MGVSEPEDAVIVGAVSDAIPDPVGVVGDHDHARPDTEAERLDAACAGAAALL